MRLVTPLSSQPVPGSYYFSKARRAGRFVHAEKQSG